MPLPGFGGAPIMGYFAVAYFAKQAMTTRSSA
jgi:hypothetical protein